MTAVDNLEKEIVKLTHSGTIQQLREKREELQWCRNSLAAAEAKLAELSKTLVTFMCECGLVLYNQNKTKWEFGFNSSLAGDYSFPFATAKTPEEAVKKFMELIG